MKIKALVADLLEHQVDTWEPFKLEIDIIDSGEFDVLSSIYNED